MAYPVFDLHCDTADRIVDTALELWHHAMGPM